VRTRAPDAGVPAGWVSGDESYGQHAALRPTLEARGMAYVPAVLVDRYTIAAVDDRIGSDLRRMPLGPRKAAVERE
jgi:hypothetical protein